MQMRLGLSVYLCLRKMHSDLVLHVFVGVPGYVMVPLTDWFSQEQILIRAVSNITFAKGRLRHKRVLTGLGDVVWALLHC